MREPTVGAYSVGAYSEPATDFGFSHYDIREKIYGTLTAKLCDMRYAKGGLSPKGHTAA